MASILSRLSRLQTAAENAKNGKIAVTFRGGLLDHRKDDLP